METSTENLVLEGPIVRSAAELAMLGMAFQIETAKDGSWRFIHVGPRCQAVTGVTAEAVMADARTLGRLIVPEHREAFVRARAEAHARLSPLDIELAMRRPDGQLRWHRISALPSAQPDGSVRWDGLQIDVTKRRAMAAELAEQRRRVEVAVEATDLGLWELDAASGRLDWSETNRALFGVDDAGEITAERYLDLVHPDDREAVRSAYLTIHDRGLAGDLKLEYRILRPDGEVRWLLSRGRFICDSHGPRRMVGTTLDITERKAAEDGRNLLMGELAHRAKNGIAIIMAIISQSARGQESVAAFEATVLSRLQAMANSQDLVMAAGGQPVDLGHLLRQSLTAFGVQHFDFDPTLDGLMIRGEAAVSMGLLLHEMATNATKHGALSSAKGRVRVMREAAADGRAAFVWREVGGPPVVVSDRTGLGTRLLQQSLRHQDGQVTFGFAPDGFHARVEFPTAR